MSFALPNIAFTLLSWLLAYSLLTKADSLAVVAGLANAGGLVFHALNGLMFGFYTGYLQTMTYNAIFEIIVYVYGLALATFYVLQFWKVITLSFPSTKETISSA